MTDTQILFVGFGLVAAAIFAVVGSVLAPVDPAIGAVPLKARWNWAAAAAAGTVVNLGLMFDALNLGGSVPSGERMGGIGIGVMCAGLVALLTYALHGDEARGPRWRKTGAAFTTAMVVLTVVVKVVT